MALQKSVIRNGLDACFDTMNGMEAGGDTFFAQQLATLLTTYLAAAQIKSEEMTDQGFVGTNKYQGTSNGTGIPILADGGVTYTPATSANPKEDGLYEKTATGGYVKTADEQPVEGKGYYSAMVIPSLIGNLEGHFLECNGDDDKLAENIAADIDQAVSMAQISVLTSGQQTLPNGTTSPAGGPGLGTFKGNAKNDIENELKSLFNDMKTYDANGNPLKGNSDFSQVLADAVDSYIKNGSISLVFAGTVVGQGTATAS